MCLLQPMLHNHWLVKRLITYFDYGSWHPMKNVHELLKIYNMYEALEFSPHGFLSILMVLNNSLASCPEEVWFQEKKKERKNFIKACSTYKKGFILVFFSFPVYFSSSPQFFTLVSYRGLTEKRKELKKNTERNLSLHSGLYIEMSFMHVNSGILICFPGLRGTRQYTFFIFSFWFIRRRHKNYKKALKYYPSTKL